MAALDVEESSCHPTSHPNQLNPEQPTQEMSTGRVTWTTSRRLLLKDPLRGISFLIDFGSDVSLLPKRFVKKCSTDCKISLYAVNRSSIETFGTKIFTVSLGLRRNFTWSFIVSLSLVLILYIIISC